MHNLKTPLKLSLIHNKHSPMIGLEIKRQRFERSKLIADIATSTKNSKNKAFIDNDTIKEYMASYSSIAKNNQFQREK